MATLDQALEQMVAAGLPPPERLVADGRLHRYGPKKRAYFKLYPFHARDGREYVSGFFGCWGLIDLTKIKAEISDVNADDRAKWQRALVQQEARERAQRLEKSRKASSRAREQWHGARARLAEGEACAYLERKRVQWENGLRLAPDGTLLVPMVRYDVTEAQERDQDYTGPRRLVGLQKITPAGEKRFNKGTAKDGAAWRCGRKPKDGELFLLGEGLATVLSVHQGLERAYTCFVAFDAGNLLPLARILRGLYPNSPILFLADDDAYLEAQLNARLFGDYDALELYKVLDGEKMLRTKRGELLVNASIYEDARGTPIMTCGIRAGETLRTLVLKNAGRSKAWEAAAAIGNAWITWPRFKARAVSPDPAAPRLTDFNDLHSAEGLASVVDQVGDAIKSIEDARELAQGLSSGTPEPNPGAGGDRGRGGDNEPDWALHGSLIRRFILVERSGTAWDRERGFLWKIEHMRLSFGVRPVAMWLASPRRKAVDLSEVVFDPGGESSDRNVVNLFRGLELKPKAGACDKLLKLLHYLCGEHEETETPISDWVLKWAAYPLQHIGAKMKTAIVMHGPEGTGKNLFWGALKQIFGRYAALISQAELEDKHNTWLSAKLFIIANEVVTRAEMSHHVGRLKNLVTEDDVYINPKMVDQRYERNHVNMVFLSNEFQPLKISPGDRRYMVVKTPAELPGHFYKQVSAEIRDGGAQAFLHHLLELELGDFDEHAKPPITEAKRALIEIGMLPSQLFWQEIKDGLIELPYGPALADDVYRAYHVWCNRRGHKMPEAQHRFTPAFMSMNGVKRIEPRVPDPEKVHELKLASNKLKKRRVFLMGERRVLQRIGGDPVTFESDREWLVEGIVEFRRALREFEGDDGRYSGSAPAGYRGA